MSRWKQGMACGALLVCLLLQTEPGARARSWSSVPADERQATALLAREQRRLHRVTPPPETSARLYERLLAAQRAGRLVGGWPAIQRWMIERTRRAAARRRRVYFLWGVYHDAALQLEAFRRAFVSPEAPQLVAVAAEIFDADDEPLRRFLATGAPSAWLRLRGWQQRSNYTAWKYGYLPQVMDLVAAARAYGKPLVGCDMSAAPRRQLKALSATTRLRLRELYCLRALGRRNGHVAMLWGQQHLLSRGVPSFLDARSEPLALYVYGGRQGPHGIEQNLARRLAIGAPLLVPLDERGRAHAVLLPGPKLRLAVDRARDRPQSPVATRAQTATLRVSSDRRFVLWIDGRRHAFKRRGRVALPDKPTVFLARSGDTTLAHVLTPPPGGALRLELDFAHRAVRQVVELSPPPR